MLAVGMPSSALPRPKPLTMGPERRIGKGGSGPVGGPTAVRGRGFVGRILVWGVRRDGGGGVLEEVYQRLVVVEVGSEMCVWKGGVSGTLIWFGTIARGEIFFRSLPHVTSAIYIL